MALEKYRQKRDFGISPEPQGVEISERQKKYFSFVVQKHHAQHLHFDLRLEVSGVYKSWAIPLGPSLDPKVKRLAVEVEDHPIGYGCFEGIIPAGQYGAGSVIVWDQGTWHPETDPASSLASGKLKFQLNGQRLKGGWSLVRTRKNAKQQQWLLIKLQDDEASTNFDVVESFNCSVISKESLATIGTLPDFIEPKLPSLTKVAPSGDEWLHELKLDGYRMQANWGADRFRLMTRSGIDWTSRFNNVANALSMLPLRGTIIDGELVAIDADGKSDFGSLQKAADQQDAITFFAFDLLFDRYRDVRSLNLLERKIRLKEICNGLEKPRIHFLDHLQGDPHALIERCKVLGLEGVVSKRVDRSYNSGRASDWLKIKFRYRENLLIGGFEISADSKSLSSLLVGYFDEARMLKFAGRVGTGWSQSVAKTLMQTFEKRLRTNNPFDKKIAPSNVTRDVIKRFIAPPMVAEIAFGSWTKYKQLRHASFHALSDGVASEWITAEILFADQQLPSDEKPQQAVTRKTATSTVLPGLSNQQRVLFPQDQLTKADVATYLFQVSQWLLPHIVDRPISLLRCTETIEGKQYFQRHPGNGFPEEIDRFIVSTDSEPLICISNTDALLATSQITAIELHPWSCHRDRMDRPDRIIIDLDPDVSVNWDTVIGAALIAKEELLQRGLQSFVKTTGGKGLHIVVPIARRYDWMKVFKYTKVFAQTLERTNANLFVANMSKARRKGKIFIDYHRNKEGATSVAAYSLRARAGATVSTPITWDELPTIRPETFTLNTVPARLKKLSSDPWEGLAEMNQLL